jgi:hypothetical protein
LEEILSDNDLFYDASNLEDFSDYVEAGLPFITSENAGKWKLGDIAYQFDIKRGRPKADEEDNLKLADLARAWGKQPPRISECRNTSGFWPSNLRTGEIYWSFYNKIRSHVQKELKGADYENQLEYAIWMLKLVADQHFETVDDLRDYINGVLFREVVQVPELPERLQVLCPMHLTEIMLIGKRIEVEE